MRKFYYLGGLPRSGSTLLTNILLQNPKFGTTATSSLLDFLLQVRDNWTKLEGHKTYEEGQDKWGVIRAIMQSYHKTDKEIIFDKNRGWSNHIEFIEKVTGEKMKIIACVRNLEDICSSFEKLFRKNRADGEIHGEFNNPQMKTIDGRVGVWTSDEGVIGRPYVSMLDTIQRGLGDRILFLPYEGWTSNPDLWFRQLYNFIGEEYFQHDFTNLNHKIKEYDSAYWAYVDHTVGKEIAYREPDYSVLGEHNQGIIDDNIEFYKLFYPEIFRHTSKRSRF
jgi:sulfotransferase